jgi:hypothetical protein
MTPKLKGLLKLKRRKPKTPPERTTDRPPLPSDSIRAVPSWVFIPENRGGNPPPDR